MNRLYSIYHKISPTRIMSPTTVIRNYGKLLKFPVPELDETLNTYVKSVEPFLNKDELSRTTKLVEDFKQNDGKQLQQLLVARSKEKNNWLTDWWLNTAYLEYRSPVVVFSSPGQVFPVRRFNETSDMLTYARDIVIAATHYKLQIDQNKIPQEMSGKHALDMSQYKKVFGTCRQPAAKRDNLIFNPNSTHIVVVSNGNYYKLEVLNNGDISSPQYVMKQLQEIYNHSLECPNPAVGVLTSQDRDKWAASYSHLKSRPENAQSIDDIEKSLFLLCLDKAALNSLGQDPLTLASYQLIHGMGSKENVNNRWYDKTIQFVVGRDGLNGITYEHSPSEGQPIAILTDYVINFIEKNLKEQIQYSSTTSTTKIQHLKFTVDETVKQQIQDANKHIDNLVDDLSVRSLVFNGYGKEFIKSQKISPDSFIQIAIQFAFYRLHREPGAHYESASLRKFDEGRTECIRSCSVESIDFARTMLDVEKDAKTKVIALRNAINAHKNYVVKAMDGQGCDRHLLGLKLLALENSKPLHGLYTDPSFTRSAYMRLSTSQVASKSSSFMCYAPLVSDGYGCCYNPRANDILFGLSAFKNPQTNVNNFAEALASSLLDMERVLIQPSAKL